MMRWSLSGYWLSIICTYCKYWNTLFLSLIVIYYTSLCICFRLQWLAFQGLFLSFYVYMYLNWFLSFVLFLFLCLSICVSVFVSSVSFFLCVYFYNSFRRPYCVLIRSTSFFLCVYLNWSFFNSSLCLCVYLSVSLCLFLCLSLCIFIICLLGGHG